MFAAIDVFEFPELHDESIAASNFFRHLNQLLQATGVKDFSLKVRSSQSAQCSTVSWLGSEWQRMPRTRWMSSS